MDEELKNRIIEIIESARTDGLLVIQEIVNQKTEYYGTLTIISLIFSIVFLSVFIYGLRKAFKLNNLEDLDTKICVVFGFILSAISLDVTISSYLSYVSPLGTILG